MKFISFFKFPFEFKFDREVIDNFVRKIEQTFSGLFGLITRILNGMIQGVQTFLNYTPWWVFLIALFLVGYLLQKKWKNGVFYVLLMSLIGLFGLWELAMLTLSIVITSVIIAIIIGLPLGILISKSDTADKIIRPILDTMQTMPIFVYLIPAIIFFSIGYPPAVIATVIYAVVPLIRLTNHGIRMVDEEIIEAAQSFGSTGMQTLFKVQLPQAMPTIMTGINQTLMMAMSMVVTTSMIGAGGLGLEVLYGVQRMELGRGLIAGLGVVILAILLDRFTQSLVKVEEGNNNE